MERDDKVYRSSVLVRVSCFSKTPGGRLRADGQFSGEEFREEYLEKYFDDDELECTVEVDLRGTEGYASSFLDEAFGGLVRKYSREKLRGRLLFQCDGIADVAREIAGIMRGAEKSNCLKKDFEMLDEAKVEMKKSRALLERLNKEYGNKG